MHLLRLCARVDHYHFVNNELKLFSKILARRSFWAFLDRFLRARTSRRGRATVVAQGGQTVNQRKGNIAIVASFEWAFGHSDAHWVEGAPALDEGRALGAGLRPRPSARP
jgi:hypothetical protein